MVAPKTAKDIPALDQALSCSLPMIFRDAEHPDYPGISGTASAVSYRQQTVFLTARHLMKSVDENVAISVPTGFGGLSTACDIDSVDYRRPDDPDFDDVSDVAILHPRDPPQFRAGSSCAYDLEGLVVNFPIAPGTLLAVRGYPRDDPRNFVDCESGKFNFLGHAVLGRYRGPFGEVVGCHSMDADTREVGGSQGFSGGPVFGVIPVDGAWSFGFAGIVLRGNDSVLHFSRRQSGDHLPPGEVRTCQSRIVKRLPPSMPHVWECCSAS
jgi:hypothetical protein